MIRGIGSGPGPTRENREAGKEHAQRMFDFANGAPLRRGISGGMIGAILDIAVEGSSHLFHIGFIEHNALPIGIAIPITGMIAGGLSGYLHKKSEQEGWGNDLGFHKDLGY